MCVKYTVSVERDCELVIKTGIDGDVWDINGPHLENYILGEGDGFLRASAVTQEMKIPVVVSEVCKRYFTAQENFERGSKGIFRIINFFADFFSQLRSHCSITFFHSQLGENNGIRRYPNFLNK
jgi:kojibiose phosphorylase